jgi:hypothetical protein
MEAAFEGGQGPERAVVPWMDGWMDVLIELNTHTHTYTFHRVYPLFTDLVLQATNILQNIQSYPDTTAIWLLKTILAFVLQHYTDAYVATKK